MSKKSRTQARQLRHVAIRKKVRGTGERPRLAIMISRRRISVQFIDDDTHRTLAAVVTDPGEQKRNVNTARWVGQQAGKVAAEKGIREIVVDRGGFKYHGRVKALVEALVQSGIRAGEPPRQRKVKAAVEEAADASSKPAGKSKDKAKSQKSPDKKEAK